MTRNELIAEINACGSMGSVRINRWIPTVAVQRGAEEFFFQDEEAAELLDLAESIPEVSTEDYILWLSKGW